MMRLGLLATAEAESYRLTIGGWTIMIASVGLVTLLLGWCIWRVLRESSAQKVQSQMDIVPPDEAKDE